VAAPQPTNAQLRPALQYALERARSGHQSRGAVGLPGRVRNLTQARRLPGAWASTLRQVLDEEPDFRGWVAGGADEGELGRLPWLWLVRPEGWSDELDVLVEEAAAADEEVREARLAHDRIASLENELAGAQAQIFELQQINATLHSDASSERAGWGIERARLQDLERSVSDLAADKTRLTEALARSEAIVLGLRSDAQGLTDELERSVRRRDVLEADLVAAEGRLLSRSEERDRLVAAAAKADRESSRSRAMAGGAVSRAASAAHELGEALRDAAQVLEGGPSESRWTAPDPVPLQGSDEGSTGRPGSRRPRPSAPRTVARSPIPLPPAVFADSPEAAAHLVRVPGVLLVVDGYNVAFTSWSGPDLAALRQRLVGALAELALRLKTSVLLVFDGADEGGRLPPPGAARPWMRVTFSASSVEADEEIVAAVEGLEGHVPVVVASNDRQVRADVRRLGANVISVEQLLTVLGRFPDPAR
jgi:predicted RNA-binding protein with PIN domain